MDSEIIDEKQLQADIAALRNGERCLEYGQTIEALGFKPDIAMADGEELSQL